MIIYDFVRRFLAQHPAVRRLLADLVVLIVGILLADFGITGEAVEVASEVASVAPV